MPVVTPDRFLKANEVKDEWGLNLLVYGPSGVGKTYFAATAQDTPLGKDVLVIDPEKGTRTIGHRSDVTVFPMDKWSDYQDIYDYLVTKPHAFKTIVTDSLTDVQEMCIDEFVGAKIRAGAAPGIQDFGKVKVAMCGMIRKFKALSTSKGWNIIFTASEDHDKDQATGIIVKSPALSPKTCQAACAIVDGIGHMSSNDKGVRTISFQNTSTVVAKLRQPQGKNMLPLKIESPSLVTILEHLSGGKQLQASTSTPSPAPQ